MYKSAVLNSRRRKIIIIRTETNTHMDEWNEIK
jgi:hypothetical protein